jgi:hypothetical protein
MFPGFYQDRYSAHVYYGNYDYKNGCEDGKGDGKGDGSGDGDGHGYGYGPGHGYGYGLLRINGEL